MSDNLLELTNSLGGKMDEALALIASIQEKKAEQGRLLDELRLWREAELQGIDSSGGGSFGLNPKLFRPRQRQEYLRFNFRFFEKLPTGGTDLKRYNYFRYPDGRVVTLNPMLEAPSHE